MSHEMRREGLYAYGPDEVGGGLACNYTAIQPVEVNREC